MTETATQYPYSPGLEGVPAGYTAISEIDSDRSSLTYRGYNVHDLAERGSYEETAYLLLYKHLPSATELAEFKAVLGSERDVPEQVYKALATLPSNANPMDSIRTGYSVLAAYDPDYRADVMDFDAKLRKAIRIIAKGTTLVGNGYRISRGLEPLKPNPAHSSAANLMHLITGEEPDPKTVETMDVSLILYAEHGFNASTFACRVTVSTLGDLYSGIVAGISTLRGPLHGGANEEAMRMILEIGSPENAEAWIRDALATKKKIMGFGHREYKRGDNRAFHMSKVAKQLGEEKGNTKYTEIAEILERVMLEEKNIYPNVDFPTGYAYYLLGIPIDLYTPIFAASRVAGYSAHAIEQLEGNRLIRPKAIYNGPSIMPYIPLSER
jgi:2-methylcitrate synthase/citrate synthase II